MRFSGLTIVRNAISNGYPIAEVLDCFRVICDEIVVCDGFSDDGTFEFLCSQSDVVVYQDVWDLSSRCGLEFARITDLGFGRCGGDYVFYLQADELLHHSDIGRIPGLIGDVGSLSFDILHIRYDFAFKLNSGYDRAIRVVRNSGGVRSEYDAYTFSGDVHPVLHVSVPVYHVGYVFIKSILRKMINHANYFYKGEETYARRRSLAEKYLNVLNSGGVLPSNIEMARILEPEYGLVEHGTTVPVALDRLVGAIEYVLP